MICSIKRLRAEIGNNALFDISAVELPGRLCAIYGPSGVGKSTFLKSLANGDAVADVGVMKFRKLLSFNKTISNIRYIPQQPPRFEFSVRTFFDRMLVANQDCRGCDDTLDSVCSAFDLKPILSSSLMDISGGQLHRVHLAAALSSNAELLLLDEPTAALDRTNVEILHRLLNDFIDHRNGFVVCCTHDASFRDQSENNILWTALDFPSFKPIKEIRNEKIFAN